MRLIIRADASLEMGTGHVMRTSTIASEFIRAGFDVIYVGFIEVLPLIQGRFQEIGLNYPVCQPEEFIIRPGKDLLLVDHYSLDIFDPFLNPTNWLKIISIADAVTPNFRCHIQVRPGLTKVDSLNGGVRVLSGPEYQLLRPSLQKVTFENLLPENPVKICLVGGGSDPTNFCKEVADYLVSTSLNFKLEVFSNSSLQNLESDSRINLRKISKDLDDVAQTCNLAFTLSSSLALEFIARELPTGVAAAVDNQRSGYEEITSNGFAAPLGVRTEHQGWMLDYDLINDLIESETLRRKLWVRVRGIHDNQGPSRVKDFILKDLSGTDR